VSLGVFACWLVVGWLVGWVGGFMVYADAMEDNV
jgi:hypothetical protein